MTPCHLRQLGGVDLCNEGPTGKLIGQSVDDRLQPTAMPAAGGIELDQHQPVCLHDLSLECLFGFNRDEVRTDIVRGCAPAPHAGDQGAKYRSVDGAAVGIAGDRTCPARTTAEVSDGKPNRRAKQYPENDSWGHSFASYLDRA